MTEKYKEDLEIMKEGLLTIKDGQDLHQYVDYHFFNVTPNYVFGLYIAASQQIMDDKIAEMIDNTEKD